MPHRALFTLSWLAVLASACAARQPAPSTHEQPLPARSAWRASSSAPEVAENASALAIDGDLGTRWGGAFSTEQWLQIDLGSMASLGGALVHWDPRIGHRHSDFAASYRLLVSRDGSAWQTVYETDDGQGDLDYVFFPAVDARYLRLVAKPLSTDWGISLFELEPLPATAAARVEGLHDAADSAAIWAGRAAAMSSRALTITLPRALSTCGLEVDWGEGSSVREAKLEARAERGDWRTLATDNAPASDHSLLAGSELQASALRLTVDQPAQIRRLRLLPPDRMKIPMRRYEVAAARGPRELFPLNVRNQQVYWTSVGIAGSPQKSIFDEFGNLEAWKGAPLVQPLWRDSRGELHAAHGGEPKHALRDAWLPMPSAVWQPQPTLSVHSEALAIEQSGQPVTLLRHRLQNTGKERAEGELFLLLRPTQIAPPWQYAGHAPIREVALEGSPSDTAVRINGRLLFHSLTEVKSRGAASFGPTGDGELTRALVSGALPTAAQAQDYDGLAAAYLGYAVALEPGETRDVVLAFPLGTQKVDILARTFPEAPAIDLAALGGADKFDALAAQVAKSWQERTGQVGVELPDRDLADMLRAQLAYILINQTGPAIQPGPRNYNRSFIRDGSATAAVLMRMGLADSAREFLRWFAEHALHENGLVSPILGEDGSVDRGFGSDLEYDSQGQFVSLVADVARLDGGAESVREYLPKVRSALRFIEELRARTLAPGYQSDKPAPERFRGILAPSISHEGYSTPTHSYWDDYWALKGLADGAWLADALGDQELHAWAKSQYAALHEAVAASIRATMAWKNISFIPSSADLGDPDATGTSIALDPCGQADLFSEAALQFTFDEYLAKIRKRAVSREIWDFTPYELRNVLTFVRLGRPADAYEVLSDQLRYRRPLAWQMFAEVVHSRLRHPGYFGDMPHTWVGTEYVRAILGMLMHDGADALELLPGTPTAWLAGEGLRLSQLHTAFGQLNLTARQQGSSLHVTLGAGLRANTPVHVKWPARNKPAKVLVDGRARSDHTEEGIRLERPFKELVARFDETPAKP